MSTIKSTKFCYLPYFFNGHLFWLQKIKVYKTQINDKLKTYKVRQGNVIFVDFNLINTKIHNKYGTSNTILHSK